MRGIITKLGPLLPHLKKAWPAIRRVGPKVGAAVAYYWQPALLTLGAVTCLAGAVATVYATTAWLAPQLGWGPAATVGGVMAAWGALKAAQLESH